MRQFRREGRSFAGLLAVGELLSLEMFLSISHSFCASNVGERSEPEENFDGERSEPNFLTTTFPLILAEILPALRSSDRWEMTQN